MLIPITRIELFKKQVSGDTITYKDTADFIIDEAVGLSVKRGIKNVKDTVNFQLLNHKELNSDGTYSFSNETNYTIDTKDLIKVYGFNSPMTGSLADHLLLNTYVKSFNYSSNEGIGNYQIKCFNRTEVLLNSFMFAPYNIGRPIPFMIVDSMTKIKNFNKNDIVHAYKDYSGLAVPGSKGAYDSAGGSVSDQTGYIRAYKSALYTAGTDTIDASKLVGGEVPAIYFFPDKPFAETYKPFMEHLEDLSVPDYTEDDTGVYVFWVDNLNNLHWKPKIMINPTDIDERDHTKVDAGKDVDDIINAIIMNAGNDPNGNGILAFAFNASSMGLNGARWKYQNFLDIGDTVRKDEFESGDRDVDGNAVTGSDNTGKSIGEDGYPDTYPWKVQTTGSDLFGAWEYTAHSDTVANSTEYKNYFRRVSKQIAENRGQEIVNQGGDPLYRTSWELELGTNDFEPNQLLSVNIPSINFAKVLRIESISHTFTNGWITVLDVKEDIDYNTKVGQ